MKMLKFISPNDPTLDGKSIIQCFLCAYAYVLPMLAVRLFGFRSVNKMKQQYAFVIYTTACTKRVKAAVPLLSGVLCSVSCAFGFPFCRENVEGEATIYFHAFHHTRVILLL